MSSSRLAERPRAITRRVELRGAGLELFRTGAGEREVVLAGPAGTGKTRACLEWLHRCAHTHPNLRALALRKTHASLTATALVTYRKQVLDPHDRVVFFGGNKEEPPHYRYPNGSSLVVGGIDDPAKVLSTEYDVIYVNQCEELTLDDWEQLTTRLRGMVLAVPQLIGDCNPQAPSHWVKERERAGKLRLLPSWHEDNPRYYDAERQQWTPEGEQYLTTLDALTGVRRDRLRFGRWAAAEGMVYETWDTRQHVVDQPPAAGRQAIAGVDWGFTNPGVIQVWQEDADGRIALVHEVYQTHRLIDWWVDTAKTLRDRYRIGTFACDPSEPAYIAQFQAAGLPASKASNEVGPGIQAVQQRLPLAGDGRPRLTVVRTALTARDPDRDAKRQPCGFLEEVEGYIWDTAKGRKRGEEPVKRDDHSMDAARYACMHLAAPSPPAFRPAVGQPRPPLPPGVR